MFHSGYVTPCLYVQPRVICFMHQVILVFVYGGYYYTRICYFCFFVTLVEYVAFISSGVASVLLGSAFCYRKVTPGSSTHAVRQAGQNVQKAR
jgi:hypothetical protein